MTSFYNHKQATKKVAVAQTKLTQAFSRATRPAEVTPRVKVHVDLSFFRSQDAEDIADARRTKSVLTKN